MTGASKEPDMRDYDLELIAALVEGRLDDETEARALIDSGPQHRTEYEAQKLAFETLRGTGTAALSETESAQLHRDLWTALRTEAAAKPAKTPWYYIWAPVTAGLFVIVGLVTVLNQIGGVDADQLAADLPVTTAADAETLGTAESGGGEASPTVEEETDSGATATTAAGSDGSTDEAVALYAAEAQRVRQGELSAPLQEYSDAGVDADTDQACVEQAGLVDHRILATLSSPDDGSRVAVAHPEDETLADSPLVFVDLTTCEIVYRDE
jgi:hypothetical protein